MNFEIAKEHAISLSRESKSDAVVYITKEGSYEMCAYSEYIADNNIHPFQIAYETGIDEANNDTRLATSQFWYERNGVNS